MDVALHWSFPLFLGTSFALAAWTQNAKIFKVKESRVSDFYIIVTRPLKYICTTLELLNCLYSLNLFNALQCQDEALTTDDY